MNKPVPGIAGFLKMVIECLEAAGVDYLIGGAVAEWAWGEPRATQDLDLVVNIPLRSIKRLSRELKKRDLLLPAEVILESVLEDRADIPINVIDPYSGMKADLYPVREGDALRRSAFNRRQRLDYGPPIGEVYVHSPEDLILYKLMYFSISQQPKHARDIAAILRARKDRLDHSYIDAWVQRLGLGSLWKELLDSAA